jgi:hypothetical protein
MLYHWSLNPPSPPQCFSGKSTLLNHLFRTNFREMDAFRGRYGVILYTPSLYIVLRFDETNSSSLTSICLNFQVTDNQRYMVGAGPEYWAMHSCNGFGRHWRKREGRGNEQLRIPNSELIETCIITEGTCLNSLFFSTVDTWLKKI